MTEQPRDNKTYPALETEYFASTAGIRAQWSDEARAYAASLSAAIDLRYRLREFRRAFPGMTQTRMAEITGEDQADISRLERGLANPSLVRANRILARLRSYVQAQEEQARMIPLAIEQRPLTSASKVAKYLLTIQDEEEAISGLKLQKLLYYAQAFALTLRHRPLFGERIKAWDHGPVVPQIWHTYKDKADQAIDRPEDFDPLSLDEPARAILDRVYVELGQYEAWKLREMTHNEEPWRSTPRNGEITQESMAAYFGPRVTAAPRQLRVRPARLAGA